MSIRRGIDKVSSAATRRGTVTQQATRSTSTQAKTSMKKRISPPLEEWDYLVLDVSQRDVLATAGVRSSTKFLTYNLPIPRAPIFR